MKLLDTAEKQAVTCEVYEASTDLLSYLMEKMREHSSKKIRQFRGRAAVKL